MNIDQIMHLIDLHGDERYNAGNAAASNMPAVEAERLRQADVLAAAIRAALVELAGSCSRHGCNVLTGTHAAECPGAGQ